ncbi:hypothetical protein Hanom_Chr01g00090931 [Helianthus anomalus]
MITILVNVLIQSCTGVFPFIYLIFPAILPFSVALIVSTSRRIIEQKLDSTC